MNKMEKRETSYNRRSGLPKHKKIMQEAVKTLLFYENLASCIKKRKKTENYSASSNRKGEKNVYGVTFDNKSNRQSVENEKTPIKMEKDEAGVLSVELTKEEWNALQDVLLDLQDDKAAEQSLQNNDSAFLPKPAVNKETRQPKPCIEKKTQENKKRKDNRFADFSFLDFEQDIDLDMLWDDTNLDDYADLFSADLLCALKAKQRSKKTRQIRFIISEDDYEEEIKISEDDYEDEL